MELAWTEGGQFEFNITELGVLGSDGGHSAPGVELLDQVPDQRQDPELYRVHVSGESQPGRNCHHHR